MRYVLGPSLSLTANPRPPVVAPPGLVDLMPTIANVDASGVLTDDSGVMLNFAAYDPAASVAPAEVRAYWLPAGSAPPADADAYVASAYINSTAAISVPVTGLAGHLLPTPASVFPAEGQPAAAFNVQVVLGFPS